MEVEKYLKELGLSEAEIRVYLACLELKESKIVPITQKAGLPRTTTFQILERLRDRKLIEIVQTAFRRIYVPLPPRNILTQLRAKKEKIVEEVESFEKSLPELNHIYELYLFQPKVRFFNGEELKTIYEEILEAPIEEAWFVSKWDKLTPALGEDFLKKWVERRIARNIKSKVLFVGGLPKNSIFRPEKGYLRTGRIAPADFDCPTHILIYDDNVALITTGEENFGLVISSREFATSMRNWFQQLWKVSK